MMLYSGIGIRLNLPR